MLQSEVGEVADTGIGELLGWDQSRFVQAFLLAFSGFPVGGPR